VSERSRSATPRGCQFKNGRDTGSAAVTELVAQRVLDMTALSPYVVIAQFHRKFIDANRSRRCAFTDGDGAAFYDEYHGRIDGYVNQILQQNGGPGFLFDIHGTRGDDNDPADVFLGTKNGRTLLPGFERRAIFMQHGLHGLLTWVRRPPLRPGQRVLRYRVSPPDEATTEIARLNGGFTVEHYGARINSIQLELVRSLRTDAQMREAFAEDLAAALVNFVRRHAPF
jgi:hypothetical protein